MKADHTKNQEKMDPKKIKEKKIEKACEQTATCKVKN